MPITNLQLITVTGKFFKFNGDPAEGTISFIPSAIITNQVANEIVYPTELKASLNRYGSFSIQLPATNDPDLSPTGWFYKVVENIRDSPTNRTYLIQLPFDLLGSTIDLADIAPLTEVPELTVQSPIVIGGGGAAPGVGDYAGYSTIGTNQTQHIAEGHEDLVVIGTKISSNANGFYPDESGGTSFDIDIPNYKITCLFDGMVQAFFNCDFAIQNAPFGVSYFHVNHSAYYQYSWSAYVGFPLAPNYGASYPGPANNGGGLQNTGIMPVYEGDELTVSCYVGKSEGGLGATIVLYQVTYLRIT